MTDDAKNLGEHICSAEGASDRSAEAAAVAPHAAHTPGPWHLDRADVGPSRYITTSAGEDVARVNGALKERDANADLIAAAPEMYEALKGLTFTPYPAHGSGFVLMVSGDVGAVRAAIAKAEGRQS